MSTFKSEIRDSVKQELAAKVAKKSYGRYLYKVILQRVRGFDAQTVTFDFPVTALVGPNGGGKTTILGAAACAYEQIKPRKFFAKSGSLDDSMRNWKIEYELVDKQINKNDTFRRKASFHTKKWDRDAADRDVIVFGVSRTVPANERVELQKCASSSYEIKQEAVFRIEPHVATAVARILGKSIEGYKGIKVDTKGRVSLLTGRTPQGAEYSEFHFGAGESSIIKMVLEIETMPSNSLILIEEIENGLHPLAAIRMVEYLIDVAKRKSAQAVFTTHSNDALLPLPSQAIWAAIGNRVLQGKLDIHSLRAITGQIEAQIAIFVEDDFAKDWISFAIRYHQDLMKYHIEVHAMGGDTLAVEVNKVHNVDPTAKYPSICYLDGDSQQKDSQEENIYRLPGEMPERYIYDKVLQIIDTWSGKLAVAMLLPYEDEKKVRATVEQVIITNTDAHLLFSQVGNQLRLTPEQQVRGAFLSIWAQAYPDEVINIANTIKSVIESAEQSKQHAKNA